MAEIRYLWDIARKTHYPSGERHTQLKRIPSSGDWVVADLVRDFNDLCEVVTVDRALRRQGIVVRWFVPFFPFARDDRRNSSADGFELGLALDLVRDLDITILDPHSDVAGQLPHVPQSSVVAYFRYMGAIRPDHLVCIPDAGAAKKAYTWIGTNDAVQCLKKRDTATGKLSGFMVVEPQLVRDRDCLIVDDICDGGGTFLGLAKLLRSLGAKSLTLAVTHGLFTKGPDELHAAFDHVYSFGPSETNTSYRLLVPKD